MSITSPSNPPQGNDKGHRQLPTLRELLSPSVSQNNNLNSLPTRFPPLTTSFSSPVTASLPSIGPYSRAPPLPSWQPTAHQAPQLPPYHMEDVPLRNPSIAYRGLDEQYDPRQRSSMPVQAPLISQSQRPSMIPGVDYRIPIGPVPQGLAEDHRRDSARSNSTYAASSTECIGQQHFPGRGLCYVYSDGATCPTVIDGELVNPLWGTTKAGKARKRLAQACLNCREKKIRCEPKHPRCAQCEKAKRECIMPATQQGQLEPSQMSNSAATLPTLTPAPIRNSIAEGAHGQPYPPAAKRRRSDEEHSPATSHSSQRDFTVRPKLNDQQYSDRPLDPVTNARAGETRPGMKYEKEDTNAFQYKSGVASSLDWDTDAWEVSKEDTSRLLDAFFSQNISVSSTMFPKTIFQRWVRTDQRKSAGERMVLYSMLALGAGSSRDNSRFGRLCAERASAAVASNFGKMTPMLAQARIFMSLYGNAVGQPHQASEYYSAAVNTLRVCKMNTEEGCEAAVRAFGRPVFDMSGPQAVECLRRTFWAGALLDTVSAVCNNFTSIVPSEIIHLRMPARDVDYEQASPSRAPFYESTSSHTFLSNRSDLATCSPLAFAISISRVASDVGHFVHSSPNAPAQTYAQEYDKFLHLVGLQHSRWLSALPPVLDIGGGNLAVAVERNATVMITSLASFYHMSVIHSVRFVRHRLLDRNLVASNIQRANESARQVLKLSGSLCAIGQNLAEGQSLQNLLSPTFAYIVFLAVETLCAGGYFSDTRDMLTAVMHGCTTFDSIGYVWAFARPRLREFERRLAKLQMLLHDPDKLAGDKEIAINHVGWRFKEPMEKHFELENDLVYGVGGDEYLAALRA